MCVCVCVCACVCVCLCARERVPKRHFSKVKCHEERGGRGGREEEEKEQLRFGVGGETERGRRRGGEGEGRHTEGGEGKGGNVCEGRHTADMGKAKNI